MATTIIAIIADNGIVNYGVRKIKGSSNSIK